MKQFELKGTKKRESYFGDVQYFYLQNKHYRMSVKVITSNSMEFIVSLINIKTKNCKKYYVNNIYNTLPKKYDSIIEAIRVLIIL